MVVAVIHKSTLRGALRFSSSALWGSWVTASLNIATDLSELDWRIMSSQLSGC